MKILALSIGALGLAHASLWVWAPKVARWQTQNVLERYQATDSLEVAMQVFQDSMRYTYIESAILGLLMLIAAALLLAHRRAGWNLWLICLGLAGIGSLITLVTMGGSVGIASRLLLLVCFSCASLKAYKSGTLVNWLHRSASL